MKVSDVVRLIEPVANLAQGIKGRLLEEAGPDQFEVEFTDSAGRTFSLVPVPVTKLKVEIF